MAHRLHYNNVIDATGVTFTESSEQTDLPSSNVATDLPSQVWRTGTSTALETLVIDLGSASTVTSCIIHNHTLTAGDSLIKIQGNATDSWGSPSVDETLTYAATTLYKVFTGGAYRYWRFTFTKASAGVTRDIGRIFLGAYVAPSKEPNRNGYKRKTVDRSLEQRTLGGQTYTWRRDSYRAPSLDFSSLDATQAAQLDALEAAVGTHKPWFFYLSGIHDTPIYCKLGSLFDPKVSGGVDGAYRWDYTLSLEEQI